MMKNGAAAPCEIPLLRTRYLNLPQVQQTKEYWHTR